jgi:hypothetical protein
LRYLLERCNQIGALFASVDEDGIRCGDPAATAHAKLLLTEFNKTFDAFFDAARQLRSH